MMSSQEDTKGRQNSCTSK